MNNKLRQAVRDGIITPEQASAIEAAGKNEKTVSPLWAKIAAVVVSVLILVAVVLGLVAAIVWLGRAIFA